MSRRSPKQQIHAREADESLHEFLARKLPPRKTKQASYFTNALKDAGARYDRLKARWKEWHEYTPRKNRLKGIAELARELASNLCKLDILSRDDLESRVDPNKLEVLIGSLGHLQEKVTNLVEEFQRDGRPRELAEERWILEVANIYENAFGASADWSRFRRFLELSRPSSFAQYGKLSPGQIKRTLERRKKLKGTSYNDDFVVGSTAPAARYHT